MLRKALTISLLFLIQLTSFAHDSWQQHADDMYEVFGFERDDRLTSWMKFVSSVLIDNNNADCAFDDSGKPFNFYDYLQEKYPEFQCKHRLLFHWGYNSRPWTKYLQNKVEYYGWSEKMIKDFQNDLIAEQKRRNAFANEYTENVFAYGHGGKEARIARALISIAYDVHLLGDYEPDNTDLDGLQEIESVVGDIINNLNVLDKQESASLCKQLRAISLSQNYNIQDKASALLDLLKKDVNNILKTADDGLIAKHLQEQGFFFDGTRKIQTIEQDVEPDKPENIHKKKSRSRSNGGFGFIILLSLASLGILLAFLFKKHKHYCPVKVDK